ncbi:MAG: excinuclease ABC subunit UvrC [Pseudomonadota bacterium]
MFESLREKLVQVSKGPGVYLMKDAEGRVIYAGKARNLKSRLASYFAHQDPANIKTGILVTKISSFDTIVTATEQEALILESTLIKRYRPRYNVILKDDKRYPVLRLDTTGPYPNLTVVRKMVKDGAHYFGPYSSAKAVHQTVKFINKTFKLCKCRKSKFNNRSRPCLQHQMGQCLGPCCLKVDQSVYDDMVHEVMLLLGGRTPDLIRKIKREMTAAADAQNFEQAAVLRDKMFSIEHITEKQVVVTHDFKDRDVLAIARSNDVSVITLLVIRGGYLIGSRHFEFVDAIVTDDEMARGFIRQYYEAAHQIPSELLLPLEFEDALLLEDWLEKLKGKRIHILFPQRGEKVRLVAMARQNAENRLKELRSTAVGEVALLHRLKNRLGLRQLPVRIECFDNSNIQGTHPVSGQVVFENAKPSKPDYRTYKIRSVSEPDDYASMAEVLGRRFGQTETDGPLPDLLMVDGGKGQLNIACSVITSLGLEGKFDILGIAKKDEKKGEAHDKIFLQGRVNPVNFGREGDLLLFLQRIRDESHRFAISFHRRQRRMSALHSELDSIPGIGKKRKHALLNHFGSVEKIRNASFEELLSVPGMNRSAAEAVKNGLTDNSKQSPMVSS